MGTPQQADDSENIYISTYHHMRLYQLLNMFRLIDNKGLVRLPALMPFMVILYCSVLLPGIKEKVAFYSDPSLKIPVIQDLPLYCLMFGVIPLYVYATALFEVELNRFVQWILREKRIDISTGELMVELERLRQFCVSRWVTRISFLLAAPGVFVWYIPELTNGKWSWVSHLGKGRWEIPTVAGIMASVYMVLATYILYVQLLKILRCGWFLARLPRYGLRVSPIHPDLCGGFGPINSLLRVSGFLICGVGIYIVSIIINNCAFLEESFARPDHIAELITLIVLAPLIYICPLFPYRRQLWWAKKDALTWVDSLGNRIVGEIERLSERAAAHQEQGIELGLNLTSVDYVANYRRRIAAMRALPLDAKTLRSFLALVYSPLLSFVVAFLSKKVMGHLF